MFHNELVNLLRTLGLDAGRPPSEEAWQQLLGDLNRSYTEAERVRFLMKRSFAFSSRELRQLNASLAAERDEFAQIFRAAPVGIARIELDGNVWVVNPAMATVVGMRPEDLCGHPLVSIVHPEEEIAMGQMLAELTSGRKSVVSGECRLVHRTGTTVFTKFGAAGVHDERGVPQHLVTVVEDVTERKRLELELRHAQNR